MNKMKYITYHSHIGPIAIITFPEFIPHYDMAVQLGIKKLDLISAGFVSGDLKCYGESIGLDLKSDPEQDTNMLLRFLGLPPDNSFDDLEKDI